VSFDLKTLDPTPTRLILIPPWGKAIVKAMFFEQIFRELQKRKIKYLVIGGIAVFLHGFHRLTADLDIIISLDKSNVKRFIAMIKNLGWKPRIPVPIDDFSDPDKRNDWIKSKGLKVFTLFNPKEQFEHMDVLLQFPLTFSKAYKNRKMAKAGSLKIPIASIEDLIKLKEKAGRDRDILDIGVLKQIRKLDREKKKIKKK